jgi:hypothetical protein
MSKQEFIAKQKALKYFGFTIAVLWLVGLGFLSLLGKVLSVGKNQLYTTCSIVYILGGAALIVWLNIRRQSQLGCICPKCGKRFYKVSAENVIATGKCGRCGETIINE